MLRTQRTQLAAVFAVAGLSLAACGGTTVESDDVTTTPSSSATSSSSTTQTSETTVSEEPSTSENPALGEEGAASEVSDFPDDAPVREPRDEAYLEALRQGGVDITGNEEQLLSTARTICGGSPITRDAVAGQLIEQQRTNLNHKDLVELIDASAHDNLC